MTMEGHRLFAALKESGGMERRLKGFLEQKDKRMLRRYSFCSVAALFFDLFSLSMILPLLNGMAMGEAVDSLPFQLVILGLIFLGKGGMELLRLWSFDSFTEDAVQRWSVKIYRLFCEESVEEHNQTTTMQKVTAVRKDTETCADMLASFIMLRLKGASLVYFFLAAIYTGHGKACILGGCLLVLAIRIYWYNRGRILECGEQKRQREIRESAMVSMAHESYKEIKIDSRAETLIEKYDVISKEYAEIHKKYVRMLVISRVVVSNIVQVVVLLAAAVLIMAGVNQQSLILNLIGALTFIVYIIPQANMFLSAYNAVQYGRRSYDAFCQNMRKYERMQQEKCERALLRIKEVGFTRGLRIDHLTFHYPDGPDILKDVSLEIPAGSSVAIVGKSGAGKTTLLDLVLGLLEPQSGHIWYDDYDLTEGRDEQGSCCGDMGRIISYIPQMVYLSDDTICNNVVFMEHQEDRKKVVDCLKTAEIWEDIQMLPKGIDTILGENGFTLSMGQRQRIILARALYKGSKLLVMDEMTAALDRETEREVMRSLKNLKERRTLLLVTHHEWLAEECDRIYRLEEQGLVRVR